MMAVNRFAANGLVDYEGEIHKQQVYVTTAGDRASFAYMKLKEIIKRQVLKGNAFIFGADFRLPVLHNLLDPNFVEEMREDGTYNPYDFAREWGSEWSGAGKDAFFDLGSLERNRVLQKAEFKDERRKGSKDIYVISVDVARCEGQRNAQTGIIIFRLKLLDNGTYIKNIVNVITIDGGHFEDQSITIKKLAFVYGASMVVVDANGLGVGLVDYMVKENVVKEDGEILPPFEVTNDPRYAQYKTATSLPLLYNVKTGGNKGEVNSKIHMDCTSQISSGKVRFLQDELSAKTRINISNKKYSASEEVEQLMPFINTSIMKDQMMNLKGKYDGEKVTLVKQAKSINKDMFSALEYGLHYIVSVLEEENRLALNTEEQDWYFFMTDM